MVEFTKQGAAAALEYADELLTAIPHTARGAVAGAYKALVAFLEAAGRAAPEDSTIDVTPEPAPKKRRARSAYGAPKRAH